MGGAEGNCLGSGTIAASFFRERCILGRCNEGTRRVSRETITNQAYRSYHVGQIGDLVFK